MNTMPAEATATAAHWSGRSRSPNIATPKTTLTSGVMKYPRLVCSTSPDVTAQTYRNQLTPMSTAASA